MNKKEMKIRKIGRNEESIKNKNEPNKNNDIALNGKKIEQNLKKMKVMIQTKWDT